MSGQVWATASLGGYMFSETLSDVLRFSLQPLVKFRQFADIKDAAVQGKQRGEAARQGPVEPGHAHFRGRECGLCAQPALHV